MYGILFDNGERPDVVLQNGMTLGGLHCGTVFRCVIDGEYTDVRLELMNDWVIVTADNKVRDVPYGLEIEILA